MQSPAHFLIGAGICRHVKCKPLGLGLALVSHFTLDALPHFEDPSILPRGIGRIAGEHWHVLLAGAQVAVACLVLVTWFRHRRGAGHPLYLVVGGLLACLPDYLHWVGGLKGVLNDLNRGSHQWWFVPYLRFVRTYPDARPLVAAWCLTVESLVCVAGALALFGRANRKERAAVAVEDATG
jgi:hypothetical protein